MIRIVRSPDLPFRDQPGRCPFCGAEVRPRPGDVFFMGVWDGRNATGERTAGSMFGTNCPECGVELTNYGAAAWDAAESAEAIWHSDGRAELVGGDRWRGRPGAWSPADAARHEARLRELLARAGSMESAIRTLHLTAGLGALQLCGLVERVAGLPRQEAKRLVVRSLAPE